MYPVLIVLDNVIVAMAGLDSHVIFVQVDTIMKLEIACHVDAILLELVVVQVLALLEIVTV